MREGQGLHVRIVRQSPPDALRLHSGCTPSRLFKRSSARYWQDSLELACLPRAKSHTGAMDQLGSTGMVS